MIIFIVICDMCNCEGIPGASRRTMHGLGWRVADWDGDLDLCPRCH